MIKTIKNLNLPLKITGSLVLVLALLNLFGSNFLATRGQRVDEMTQEILKLEKENSFLTQEVSRLSSLSQLEARALTLGFQKIDKPIALTTPAPVALAR